MPPFWYVYVLQSTCLPRTYVGIALEPHRRLSQHNGELPGGARTTRAGRPWELAVVYGPYVTRGDAQRAERRIKTLRGAQRLALLSVLS